MHYNTCCNKNLYGKSFRVYLRVVRTWPKKSMTQEARFTWYGFYENVMRSDKCGLKSGKANVSGEPEMLKKVKICKKKSFDGGNIPTVFWGCMSAKIRHHRSCISRSSTHSRSSLLSTEMDFVIVFSAEPLRLVSITERKISRKYYMPQWESNSPLLNST